MNPYFTVACELRATELFAEESSPEALFCQEHASFLHPKTSAFVIHLGGESPDEGLLSVLVAQMRAVGLRPAFIDAVCNAARMGAVWLFVYA